VGGTDLTRQQRESLWLDGHAGLYTVADALSFMNEVGVALRYGAAANLPIASMYRATQRQVPTPEDEKTAHARAFELTNGIMATGKVVEINLIANRISLAHERILSAIYALRRGRREPTVSDAARQAVDFIIANETATSGEIRRILRADARHRPDSADLALAELQRELLVDRGPSAGPSKGVFYLTREGYPYRVFATTHPAIVSSARNLGRQEAAAQLLTTYVAAAGFATRRNLVGLFQLLLTVEEINETIQMLATSGRVRLSRPGKNEMIVYDGA
jgi:Winged helix DNA-binding domain